MQKLRLCKQERVARPQCSCECADAQTWALNSGNKCIMTTHLTTGKHRSLLPMAAAATAMHPFQARGAEDWLGQHFRPGLLLALL